MKGIVAAHLNAFALPRMREGLDTLANYVVSGDTEALRNENQSAGARFRPSSTVIQLRPYRNADRQQDILKPEAGALGGTSLLRPGRFGKSQPPEPLGAPKHRIRIAFAFARGGGPMGQSIGQDRGDRNRPVGSCRSGRHCDRPIARRKRPRPAWASLFLSPHNRKRPRGPLSVSLYRSGSRSGLGRTMLLDEAPGIFRSERALNR